MTQPTSEPPSSGRFIGRPRRLREDFRFITGRGHYVADVVRPGMLQVATLGSPHAHARIVDIDVEAARRMPGVVAVVTGRELAPAINPIPQYADVHGVNWYPLAVDKVRYAGEAVAAVVAEDRYQAEDALEAITVTYDPLPPVVDPEAALRPDAPLVHEEWGSNCIWHRTFQWGAVDAAFAQADHIVRERLRWSRHAGVPLETTGVVAEWDAGQHLLDIWAAVSMPQFAEILAGCLRLSLSQVRAHYDVDIGGSYGVKRGMKHAVLTGFLARRIGRPVQFVEDRLENMRAGDAHGPDRIFEIELAARRDGTLLGLRLKTIDDEGAYPGRAPAQMGKPIGAIVGPYQIPAVAYEVVAVTTNKTSQTAYRGFGQSPTNFAIERALDKMAYALGLDRVEIRRRNFIPPEAFPYRIPSGTYYDSGNYPEVLDKALRAADWDHLLAERDRLRRQGRLVGVGIASCIEPGGGNALFQAILNPKNDATTFPEGCYLKIDRDGNLVAAIAFPSAGQGHESLVAQVLGEEFETDPDTIRIIRADSLSGLPTQTPVGSRMAIVLVGAVHGAAEKIKRKLVAIAAHLLHLPPEQLRYARRGVEWTFDPHRRVEWSELVAAAHRHYHKLPPGMEPGLQALYVWEVPNGGTLPAPDGTVFLYPCHAFDVQIVMAEVSRESGQVRILRHVISHDCGTPINPLVVDGMAIGGTAHGIGAALMERFVYAPDGQFLTASFLDYLMPTAMDVPRMTLAETVTPSPWTTFGQKGSGEGGYMTAPAAVVSAVEDAVSPGHLTQTAIPLDPQALYQLATATEERGERHGD